MKTQDKNRRDNEMGSRRDFLKAAAATTAGLALTTPLSGCAADAEGSAATGGSASGQLNGGEIKLGVPVTPLGS